MAHFYGEIRGSRGEATRQGTAESGMFGHVRGWGIGCMANCWVGPNGRDRVTITVTSGSNGGPDKSLGTYEKNDEGEFVKV